MDEPQTRRFTFKKEERLTSKIIIDKLFTEGKTIFVYPLRFVFISTDKNDQEPRVKVVFTVSKRNYKKAVDRNLIKRRMREAYRLNKQSFYDALENNEKQFALMIIYTDKSISTYQTMERAMVKGMRKMVSKVNA